MNESIGLLIIIFAVLALVVQVLSLYREIKNTHYLRGWHARYKIDYAYMYVILPSYELFARSDGSEHIQSVMSTIYNTFIDDIERSKGMFDKKEQFYTLLNNLQEECKTRDGNHREYNMEENVHVMDTLITPLHDAYAEVS